MGNRSLLNIFVALCLSFSFAAGADEENKKKHRASSHHATRTQTETAPTPADKPKTVERLDALATKAAEWKKVHENQTLEKATAQCPGTYRKEMAKHLYLFEEGVKTPVAKIGLGDVMELLFVMDHDYGCLRPKNKFGIRRWFDEPTVAVTEKEE